MTKLGAIIGTVPYMSPEQLDGKEVDARSDIFSLGAVLYEMVTGNRAFQGNSEFSVASDILHKDPSPISTLQSLTPPALERTIRVCLAKDPDLRWQSASDLWNELRWISEGGSQSGSMTAPQPGSQPGVRIVPTSRRVGRTKTAWIVAGLFAVIARP
jgi:serine/threonine protein kinase